MSYISKVVQNRQYLTVVDEYEAISDLTNGAFSVTLNDSDKFKSTHVECLRNDRDIVTMEYSYELTLCNFI